MARRDYSQRTIADTLIETGDRKRLRLDRLERMSSLLDWARWMIFLAISAPLAVAGRATVLHASFALASITDRTKDWTIGARRHIGKPVDERRYLADSNQRDRPKCLYQSMIKPLFSFARNATTLPPLTTAEHEQRPIASG